MWILAALSGHAVPLLCGLLCVYMVSRSLVYAKLRRFGGPVWTGFTDWPHSMAMLQNNCHEWYAGISEKYGPIARVAPEVLVTSSPEVWMHVCSKPGYKRSDWFYNACRIEHRRDNIFSQTDNGKHERRRKQMAPGYSGRENLDFELSIDLRVQEFIGLIRSKYLSSDGQVVPMDLGQKVQYFTLDVISAVGLGKTFGMLRSDSDVDDYLKSSQEGLSMGNAALAMGFSGLAHTPLIGRFIAPSPTDNSGFGKMMAACFRYVDERAANPTDKRSDMLASFIRHGLSGDELRSEVLEQIIAGSDTTASAICGTLLHVMTNPRVYAKLQREVDDAVRDSGAPRAREGLIATTQVKQLPYLQAVVREGLRVWPPVASIFPRDVPPGGDTVVVDGEDVFLPGGVCVGYSAYAMHHSEAVYGADAKAFRPERWFESDPGKLAAMVRTNDLIFGHAKSQCLGKSVAQVEIRKAVFEVCGPCPPRRYHLAERPQLLRNFDMALINPTHPWEAHNCLGLFAISNMWVQVMERKPLEILV
ncbi:Pisatin demethylase [Tolypocladium ophioglossoides CBS 100239]|uniref:Pisatin demethylase n=1 Tax=Tolypocladium ophioglossoides (strain CBS 100239) TaxID=1163406 RepID=A0A0L0N2W4_TOLOC|nr:Pisatin demethylase [Tolypocladium ophioglossoides CBS 100239]